MSEYKAIFSRYEKKYVLTNEQQRLLLSCIAPWLRTDEYGPATVCNIYFDTPDYRLIRASIERPAFKEKLRLRAYQIPTKASTVFVEIKRKYNGIVYKRRVSMRYDDAVDWLCRYRTPDCSAQIPKEIAYFTQYYPGLAPKVSLFYDREAFVGKDDPSLRITFDKNIRFRTHNLDLSLGDGGCRRIGEGRVVMEIKCDAAFPLWLCNALSALHIHPASFSKYGVAFETMMRRTREAATETA